jgi:hypothetical protein
VAKVARLHRRRSTEDPCRVRRRRGGHRGSAASAQAMPRLPGHAEGGVAHASSAQTRRGRRWKQGPTGEGGRRTSAARKHVHRRGNGPRGEAGEEEVEERRKSTERTLARSRKAEEVGRRRNRRRSAAAEGGERRAPARLRASRPDCLQEEVRGVEALLKAASALVGVA